MAASEHIQTDLDRDPEWWANWFEQDFSWEGLKKKPWRGWVVVDEDRCMPMVDAPEDATIRDASLQDYWRADPEADWAFRELDEPGEAGSQAELVRLGDTIWHRAHVPPATLEGARSWKANPEDERFETHWERVQADLQTRLAQGFESKFDWSGEPKDADGRAQLDGAIINALSLPHENEGSPVYISMVCAAHLLRIKAEKIQFGAGANFASASFGDTVDFNSASFSGNTRFDSASFGGDARFNSASFGESASFESASFRSASFGSASFESASFESASFESANFGGDAHFDSASFSWVVDFCSSSFGGHTSFYSASSGGVALFDSASFGGKASFNSASFGGDARFDRVLFLTGANFQRGHASAQVAGRLVQGETGEKAAKALSVASKDTDYTLVLSHGAAKRETGAFQSFSFSEGLSLGALDFSDRVFSKAPIFENAQFFWSAPFLSGGTT